MEERQKGCGAEGCGKRLVFYELKSFDQLEEGYFHIPEPARGES